MKRKNGMNWIKDADVHESADWYNAKLLAGTFGLVFVRALQQAPLAPIGDPFLQESLHYQAWAARRMGWKGE